MAVLMILELPGATVEQYERVNEILGVSGDDSAPEGLISHHMGLTDDGLFVADVWDSPESLERFMESVGPAMQEAGAPEGPPPRVLPVHNHFEGAGSDAGVIMIAEVDDLGPEGYDQMLAGMESHASPGTHPAVQHTAAVSESGGIVVVDVWGSPEEFGEFAQSEIAPAAEEAGMGELEPRFVPVHNRLRGAAG